MKRLLIALFLLVSLQTHAISFDEIGAKIKPFVEKILGADFAKKIFGEDTTESLVLPVIPKINKDTKNTEIYNQKSDTEVFSKEKMEKYNVSYVQELVQAIREVPANRDEIGKWYNTLYQGATREGIYRALVLDEYYRRLENYEDQSSKASREFTISFMDKFIGKSVTMEKLQDLNIYSIKRIVTEDALDIADTFLLSNNKEDFYTWYAIFSAQIAKDYPIWDNRLRASANSKQHLAWAKKMPLQFVKSEIILKLHILFNHLQKRAN